MSADDVLGSTATDPPDEPGIVPGLFRSESDVIQATDLIGPWAIRAAATLRIADILAIRPREVADLAAELGVNEDALRRLLRYLARRGLFQEQNADTYATTSIAAVLYDDHPWRLRKWLDYDGAGGRMALATPGMLSALRTGTAAYKEICGREFWDDLEHSPEISDSYDALMGDLSEAMAPGIVKVYDWGKIGHLVDVGGGNGTLISSLLKCYKNLTATLVEMPRTAARAADRLRSDDLLDRCRVIAGDMFDPLPPSADVYLLSFVLHAFADNAAAQILRRCAQAGNPDSHIMVIECVTDGAESIEMAAHDLRMLTLVGGVERSRSQFTELFARADLRLISANNVGTGEVVFLCEADSRIGAGNRELSLYNSQRMGSKIVASQRRGDVRFGQTAIGRQRDPWPFSGLR
jgi:hypothetical protein